MFPGDESSYHVRRLQPKDAPGVRALVERVYGMTYFHGELYESSELLRLNQLGQLVSVVTVAGAGQVVGHYALERPDLGAIAETGEGMILPEHRGHHLFSRMRALLEEEAGRLGLAGVSGRPLTIHVRSQKVYEEFHCYPTGIELARFNAVTNDLSGSAPQRLSALMYFKYLRAPAPTVYHLPDHHRGLVEKIIQRLGKAVTFQSARPAEGDGVVESEYHARARAGFVHVRQLGRDCMPRIDQERARLHALGAQSVFLRLPLAQAGTDLLCRTAERHGFFFCGLDPRADAEGDILELQALSTPVDVETLHIDEPFAQEIAAYVAQRQAEAR
jgi:serine/threonine-protein kinase RsbW